MKKQDEFFINNNTNPDSVTESKGKIYYVPLSQLIDNPLNKINEKYDTEDDLKKLCDNILVQGLKVPLSVTKTNDNFLIQSGHRRKKAILELLNKKETIMFEDRVVSFESIPVLITKEYKTDFEQFMSILAFNTQRTGNKERDKEVAKEQLKLLKKFEEDGYKFEGRKRDIIARNLGVSGRTVGRWTDTSKKKKNNKELAGEKLIKTIESCIEKVTKKKLIITEEERETLIKKLTLLTVYLSERKDAGQMSRKEK